MCLVALCMLLTLEDKIMELLFFNLLVLILFLPLGFFILYVIDFIRVLYDEFKEKKRGK